MQSIGLRQVSDFVDHVVVLNGWVTHVRHSGKLVFFELRDGSDEIQCVVFTGDVDNSVFNMAKSLTTETSCSVTGTVRRDKRSKIGFEIGVSNLTIIHTPVEEYPISPKEHGVAFLMEHRHLWLRSSRQIRIQNIRSTIINSIQYFFAEHDFIRFDPPILTPVACEGTTTLFETAYFDDKAYLTQSGQLYCEAGAMALGKVYSFGPTFRAEKSKTRRHLTEFWMIEPEAAFYELDDVMNLAEKFVAYLVETIVVKHSADLNELGRDIEPLKKVRLPFPRLTYSEAIELLHEQGVKIDYGDDFGAEHETVISNHFDAPVLVHRYPAACKAFYMKNDPTDDTLALCVDMLAPEGYGEIIGGGQREDEYQTLRDKIAKHGLKEESMSWYLDLRKYGSVPHGGFGMGLERFIAWICGLHHVRETIPFPRMLERIQP